MFQVLKIMRDKSFGLDGWACGYGVVPDVLDVSSNGAVVMSVDVSKVVVHPGMVANATVKHTGTKNRNRGFMCLLLSLRCSFKSHLI